MTDRIPGGRESRLFPEDAKPASGGPITAYCDGGSRGNPGPAGFGVYIQDENGTPLRELSEFLGRKTNNFAEYSALLAALNYALENGRPWLRVVSDSELMVKQIKGQYKVGSPDLRPLYDEAKRRIAKLSKFEIQHVLRDKNRHADRLANLAMDRGMGRAPQPAGEPIPVAAPIPIVRAGQAERPRTVRGFVKGGVVHLIEGELPDGVFVRITRE